LFAKETMNKFVSIRLTEEEKKEIERKADACCLTRSQYIRQTALGIVPRSKLDHQAVHALAKLNGDIGRVGGLLKLWLTRNEDADLHHSLDVREIVKEISFVKLAILEAIEKI
jgi:putative plasmid conjugal transfer protein